MATISERLRAIDHMSVEDCFMQSPLYDKAADTIDALVAALELAKDRLDPFDEAEATMHQIDAALALARGEK